MSVSAIDTNTYRFCSSHTSFADVRPTGSRSVPSAVWNSGDVAAFAQPGSFATPSVAIGPAARRTYDAHGGAGCNGRRRGAVAEVARRLADAHVEPVHVGRHVLEEVLAHERRIDLLRLRARPGVDARGEREQRDDGFHTISSDASA